MMLKGLCEGLNNIRKTQSEKKDTLIKKKKKQFKGNQQQCGQSPESNQQLGTQGSENQTIITARKKKNKKNENSVRSLRNNFKQINIQLIGVPKEKRKTRNWTPIRKNNDRKRPQLGEGNRHTSPRSRECLKQNEHQDIS